MFARSFVIWRVGSYFSIKAISPCIGIPIITITPPSDCLIFIMGISRQVRWYLYSGKGKGPSYRSELLGQFSLLVICLDFLEWVENAALLFIISLAADWYKRSLAATLAVKCWCDLKKNKTRRVPYGESNEWGLNNPAVGRAPLINIV